MLLPKNGSSYPEKEKKSKYSRREEGGGGRLNSQTHTSFVAVFRIFFSFFPKINLWIRVSPTYFILVINNILN